MRNGFGKASSAGIEIIVNREVLSSYEFPGKACSFRNVFAAIS